MEKFTAYSKIKNELMRYIALFGETETDRNHPFFSINVKNPSYPLDSYRHADLIISGKNPRKHIKNLARIAYRLMEDKYSVGISGGAAGAMEITKTGSKRYRLQRMHLGREGISVYPTLESGLREMIGLVRGVKN